MAIKLRGACAASDIATRARQSHMMAAFLRPGGPTIVTRRPGAAARAPNFSAHPEIPPRSHVMGAPPPMHGSTPSHVMGAGKCRIPNLFS